MGTVKSHLLWYKVTNWTAEKKKDVLCLFIC